MSISSLHPVHWLAIFGIVISMVLVVAAFRCRGWQLKGWLFALALAALVPAALVVKASYPEWSDPRIQAYQAFFDDIPLDTTRAEVLDLLAKHYPESDPRQRPRIMIDEADSLTFFMHPEDPLSPVDCEAILLTLREGRVVAKEYSPD